MNKAKLKYYCIDCLKKGIKTEIHWCTALYRGGRCKSCARKGKSNPNWKCGISKLPYSYTFTIQLKESIKER